VGANARYFLAVWSARRFGAALPVGTLIINVSGSFLVGLVLTLIADRAVEDPAWRLALAVGFCGAYTTFSTYSFETVALLQQGAYALAALYSLGSVALGLGSVVAGASVARLL
jgi:CrcB protein